MLVLIDVCVLLGRTAFSLIFTACLQCMICLIPFFSYRDVFVFVKEHAIYMYFRFKKALRFIKRSLQYRFK